MKKVILSIAISLVCVSSFAQKSEWEKEGEMWAVSTRCMTPAFTQEFKSVGIEYLKLSGGPADGPGIAGDAQRRIQFLADSLSNTDCVDQQPGLQALHKQRVENLRKIKEIARSVKK